MKLNDYSLWTALVTPLTPGLQVDYKSLEALVKEQTDAKNGLLILGSTAEALNLDLETRKNIVNFVLELKPSTPIIVGIGGHALPAQQSWLKWLETKPIDAYLMVTPIYAKPGSDGQYQWFKVLMDQAKKPVMLYNVPGRSGIELCLAAISKLKNHINFWAIKEASGSVEKMKQYLNASSNGKVFCGDDGLLSEFTNAGSCGLVSVASNTWPVETNLYVQKCLDKSLDDKVLWSSAANSLFIASNPIPAKALLAHEGRISHDTLMPPLSRRDLKDLTLLTQSSKNIRNWYKNNK
jgi:4-hydroxy-tetrahydrodipicolinate synthase